MTRSAGGACRWALHDSCAGAQHGMQAARQAGVPAATGVDRRLLSARAAGAPDASGTRGCHQKYAWRLPVSLQPQQTLRYIQTIVA